MFFNPLTCQLVNRRSRQLSHFITLRIGRASPGQSHCFIFRTFFSEKMQQKDATFPELYKLSSLRHGPLGL
jgi:hypothetical protein